MEAPAADDVRAGYAVYTKSLLGFYDLWVLRLSSSLVWRCPMRRTLALYDRHVTGNHLDVGVGTGAFLDLCRWPVRRPRIGLMDANENCLRAAGHRLARYAPEIVRADVLQPVPGPLARFDSISMTFLLHCLPGTIRDKGVVLRNLAPLLNPGGVVFGATLLSGGVPRSWSARRLMALYNSRRIFTNEHDDLAGLDRTLREHLSSVEVEIVGCAALFSGRLPS